MKQTAILLLLLFLLSGCGTVERTESKAQKPDSFLSEPVTSSSESTIQEEAEVVEAEAMEAESSVPSTSVETPAETNAPTEAESISSSAGKNEPQNETEPVEAPQPESSTPEQPQEMPEPTQNAPEPEFDVEVWLNLARRYGGEIGLSYDGTATGGLHSFRFSYPYSTKKWRKQDNEAAASALANGTYDLGTGVRGEGLHIKNSQGSMAETLAIAVLPRQNRCSGFSSIIQGFYTIYCATSLFSFAGGSTKADLAGLISGNGSGRYPLGRVNSKRNSTASVKLLP